MKPRASGASTEHLNHDALEETTARQLKCSVNRTIGGGTRKNRLNPLGIPPQQQQQQVQSHSLDVEENPIPIIHPSHPDVFVRQKNRIGL